MATIPDGTAADVDRAVAAARKARSTAGRQTSVEERAKYLHPHPARASSARTDEIATVVAQEVGMPMKLAPDHPGRPAAWPTSASPPRCVAELRRSRRQVGNSLVVREPIGVVGCITPWNYPLHQIAAEGRARPRRRLHGRAEAERGRAGQRVHPRRGHRRGRPAGRRVQPRDRASVRWWARPSPPIPTSTWCRSPARPAPASASPRSRRRRSSGSPSSSAASRPTSSSTMPTSRRPSPDGVGKCYLNSGQTCTALTRMLVPRCTARRGGGASPRRRPRRSRPAIRSTRTTRLGPLVSDGAARAGARLHREGHRRGRQAGHRRRRRARGPRQGLLREADRLLRRHAAT